MALEGDRHLIVILGYTGDLARRKLLSSLYRIIMPGASASPTSIPDQRPHW